MNLVRFFSRHRNCRKRQQNGDARFHPKQGARDEQFQERGTRRFIGNETLQFNRIFKLGKAHVVLNKKPKRQDSTELLTPSTVPRIKTTNNLETAVSIGKTDRINSLFAIPTAPSINRS